VGPCRTTGKVYEFSELQKFLKCAKKYLKNPRPFFVFMKKISFYQYWWFVTLVTLQIMLTGKSSFLSFILKLKTML